tara:strand:+ start:597 stop:875 length:279 start_codon:yes stop_codon:yes gene_type:complete
MFLRRAVMTNEDELVNKGEDAEMLLGLDAFTNMVDSQIQAATQQFFASDPEDFEMREDAYLQYRALAELISTLRQQVEVLAQIKSKATPEEE